MTYFAGQGTVLRRGQSIGAAIVSVGSEVFDTIALVGTLKLPADVRTVNSFKTLDSPDPRKIGGGFEDRTVSFRLVVDWLDAIHVSLRADAKIANSALALRNWRVALPDTGAYQYDFRGFIAKWEPEDVENEKEFAVAIDIAVDGSVTEAV